MKYTTVPFVGGFYRDETLAWSAQDCLNYLPAAAEVPGTRTQQKLITAPGLKPYAYLGAQPIRGVYNCEGRLFIVAGNNLYQILANGKIGLIGQIPGVNRVSFAHNQISNGNQLLVNNGSAGYVYDTVAKTFTRITDAGYPGGTGAVFIDGYIIQIEPARRYAFNSAVADATSYNTLDRFTSEVSPDLLVGLAVVNNELVLFSQTTTEFFEDTGATSQPFRTKRITMTRGCAGQFTIANMDNTIYWLGNDGIFYVLNGYAPLRISTRPIEQAIRDLDWSQCFSFVWEDNGHKVCYWTFPDGNSWGYDVSSRQWHRRESYGFDRWRVNALTSWNDLWIAGDFQDGSLFSIDWNYFLEGSSPYVSMRTTGVLSDNQNLVLVPRLELLVQAGAPTTVSQPFTYTLPSISGSLGNGTKGDIVSFQYAITGGQTPYGSFYIYSGALPGGLSMDSAGIVTGTRTSGGFASWVVACTDAAGTIVTHPDASQTAYNWLYTFVAGDVQTEQIGRIALPINDRGSSLVLGASDSHIFKSTNGKTWTAVSTAVNVPMYQGRSLATTSNAWFASIGDVSNNGHLYKSADQGATWQELLYLGLSIDLPQMIASDTCVFCMNYIGDNIYSTDNGATWNVASVPSGFNPGDSILPFRGIYVDSWSYWVIPGQNQIYASSGTTPSTVSVVMASTDRVSAAAYSPTLDMVVVVGPANAVYTKTKAGAWQTVTIPSAGGNIYDVCWVPPLKLFVGMGSSGTLVITSSDGVTWTNHATSGISLGLTGTSSCLWMDGAQEILAMYENSVNYRPFVSDI